MELYKLSRQVLPCCVVAVVAAVVTWQFAHKDAESVQEEQGKLCPSSIADANGAQGVSTDGGGASGPVAGKGRPIDEKSAADVVTDDLSGAHVRIRSDELEPTLAEKDLKPETMEELRKLFSKFESGKTTDEHFLQALCCYQPRVVLAAARSMLRFGTKSEKCNALWAVGMMYSNDARHALEVRQGGAASDAQDAPGVLVSSEPPQSAAGEGAESADGANDVDSDLQIQSCGVVSAIGAGLSDADADVREAAFEVMKALPASESAVVASQAMSGKDTELQTAMLDAAKGGNDDLSVRIALMGTGSEDASVRAAALENLKGVSGQSFQSQQDASAWYAEHAQEFQQVAEGQQEQMKN